MHTPQNILPTCLTKQHRVLYGAIAVCIIALLTVSALETQRPSYSDSRRHWIAVNADPESRDTKLLDAIIRDAVTNQDLAWARQAYGGMSNTTVRYTGFPQSYQPAVAGYRFEPLPIPAAV